MVEHLPSMSKALVQPSHLKTNNNGQINTKKEF
jgi:hypothetical protein